ncbi:cupin domain-containing protein, partial [Myxococcota bacterium]|nr:cupin domain-containing protein [Myxococcota bacterium]
LLNTGLWREVNLITSDEGATRGRHFHKETEECFIILSGRIRVEFRKPTEAGAWLEEEATFGMGDVFTVKPEVEHTFFVLEKAQWINLLTKPVDQENPDFHQYPETG